MARKVKSKVKGLVVPKKKITSPANKAAKDEIKKERNRKLAKISKANIKKEEAELTEKHTMVMEKWKHCQRLFKLIEKIEKLKGKAYTEKLKAEALEFARQRELTRSHGQQNGEQEGAAH
eukprot:TRINITY_DN36277_c0_g1_i2.p1 TRINITY_DN36277_c0_g1~~TRINITY_DN36277_c0_g1_i2.p1  ORF type:complete len:120 (+),score=26.63 TRINITY_DN36277_c0_g1_i2:38-397(+)